MYTRHVAHRSDSRTFGAKYAPWPIVTLVLYRRATAPASSGRRAETRARDDDDTCICVHRPVARDSQRANRLYRPTHPIVMDVLNIIHFIGTPNTRLCLYRLYNIQEVIDIVCIIDRIKKTNL